MASSKKKKQTPKITPVQQQKSDNDTAHQNKAGQAKKQKAVKVCFLFLTILFFKYVFLVTLQQILM